MSKIVLTLMADDRPGLVRAVSDIVVSHGGNWLESRMADLAGTFTGLILVEVADEQKAAMLAALQDFATGDITLTVRDAGGQSMGDGAELKLAIVGADHPGIVHEITDLLHARNINIAEMETDHHAAAMSGQPVFEAEILAIIPEGADKAALQSELEQVAVDLMVDITFD